MAWQRPKVSSLYKYKTKYPMEMESVCSVCGCKLRVIVTGTQQARTKFYCRHPCTAGRMSPAKVTWAESWPEGAKAEQFIEPVDYLALLRKSRGISQEAVDESKRLLAINSEAE